jgi:pimeloyl-ACP methyl ester carboxylesterase
VERRRNQLGRHGQLAAQGAIILPFSYNTQGCQPSTGAQLTGSAQNPNFIFPGYTGGLTGDSTVTNCITPVALGTAGGGGFGGGPGPNYWGSVLDSELASIHQVWPTSKVVVIGHSQGGLVVTDAWLQGFNLPHVEAFSLDSPINGSCGTPLCIGPPGYPDFDLRTRYDEGSNGYLGIDQSQGNPMHFIGTYGDSPVIPIIGPINIHSYGSGSETLEHQMPFDYGPSEQPFQVEHDCNVEAGAKVNPQCPAPSPPDHISRCSVDYFSVAPWIQDTGHFVVKYCPDVINYINGVLKISTRPSPPANPPADAIAAWNATDGGCASTMAASLRHVASLLPSSDTTQIADLDQFATLPLSELSGPQQAQGQADLTALNTFFGTDRALTTFTGPCSAAPPSTPPPTTPPSTPPSTLVSPGNESPADAVDGFYQSELAGDWAAVCSYVTPSAQSLCLAGTSGQAAATGTANVGTMVISASGNEALVSVTGSICAPSSPCVSNGDAGLGMPSSPSQFAADYQAAVANTTGSTTVLSPMPCSQIGGKWYVDFG